MVSCRLLSVLGLGFGDCGKGRFVDHLCHRLGIPVVVRFNGGAQAGHNVVLADGRHHTFSQFGSGTFVPGVRTLLAHTVVVHPTALGLEAGHLADLGVPDALARIRIDPRCRVTTPFHQALGRMRELARGRFAHGTCGVGVGETVRQDLEAPGTALRFGDLWDRALTREKLEHLRRRTLEEALDLALPPSAEPERRLFLDPNVCGRWQGHVAEVLARVRRCDEGLLGTTLREPGRVLFEGAQGLLLDEAAGFHPHTTWSSVGPLAVEALVRDTGLTESVHHHGVLRAYLTRHGPGPMPTEDPGLDRLEEPHNPDQGWQGRFRRGQPDGVLLDYARQSAGRTFQGLFLSHLDAFGQVGRLKWCEAYEVGPGRCATLAGLGTDEGGPLARQERLGTLVGTARPVYAPGFIESGADLQARVEAALGAPVKLTSQGRIREQVTERRPGDGS